MHLRPYQEKATSDIRDAFTKHRRVLFVMATGGGKTATVTYIAKGVENKGKRVLILAHRRELLHQISDALRKWRVRHSIIDAETPGIPRTNVVVGSVFTVFRRLSFMPQYDLIIQDEAHHCSGSNTFSSVLNNFRHARHLGITATPARHSMEPMGASFDTLVFGPQTAELIASGFLCAPAIYAPAIPDLTGVPVRAGDYAIGELSAAMDKPSITGDSIKHYRKLGEGKRAIVFTVSITHAEDVAHEFNAAGIPAANVDGKMDRAERDRRIRRFADGTTPVLTSVNLISEGFDCPQAEVGIMLRPTESMPLYLQMVGRLLRPYEGKQHAIILDHAGLTRKHGFPDEPREWSLDGITQAQKEYVPRVRTCERCFACFSPTLQECPRCGHTNKVKKRKIRHVEGDLELVTDGSEYTAPSTGDHMKDMQTQYYQLRAVARKRGWAMPRSESWAFRIVSARLADRLAREKRDAAAALEELEMRTIRRDSVTRAMSGE